VVPYEEPEEEEEEAEEEEEEEETPKSKAEKLNAINQKAQGEPGKNEFGDDGKPTTGTDGKKLTPADMFSAGDVITVTVGKSNPKQDSGLKFEERNGKYYVRKVPSGGLFAKTPVIAGDKVLELNGKDSHDYKNVNEMKLAVKEASKITIVVLRTDPDASDSSASSVDYDNLAPIDGVKEEEIEDKDDDTVGYDGHDCGCAWCPDCH
jgi:predicted metalloprotease with PDZ domain